MIDISQVHLSMLADMLHRHVPFCEVRAFGSRVVGKAKPYSDLDLAIRGKEHLPRQVLYALKDDLEESDLPFRVDVLDWNAISPEFQTVIEKKYEVIQHPE